MDKNTTIGLVLIFAVLMVFSYLNKPSPEQVETKRKTDSIALVQQQQQIEHETELLRENNKVEQIVAVSTTDEGQTNNLLQNLYGDFSISAQGDEEFYVIENNLLKVEISSKGGSVHSVELKNYKRHDSTDLILIEGGNQLKTSRFSHKIEI